MSGKSRTKGKVGERLARDYLRSLGWVDARRGQQYSGTEGRDVVCLDTLPHVHFEIKYGYGKVDVGSSLVHDWWDQAIRDANKNSRLPILLWKPHRAKQWRMTFGWYGLVVTIADDEQAKLVLSACAASQVCSSSC